jgi:hypothetical protein
MKYLSSYIEEAQTKAFNFAGAFFAFSDEQFEEKRVQSEEYESLGGGLICPKKNSAWLRKKLILAYKKGIEQDMKENGKKAIIKRELNNYEVCYTGDPTDTINALADYPITEKEIIEMM